MSSAVVIERGDPEDLKKRLGCDGFGSERAESGQEREQGVGHHRPDTGHGGQQRSTVTKVFIAGDEDGVVFIEQDHFGADAGLAPGEQTREQARPERGWPGSSVGHLRR